VVVVKMSTTKTITTTCQLGTLRAEVESLKSVFILHIKVPTWHFERKNASNRETDHAVISVL
jgi:hypothetical protein